MPYLLNDSRGKEKKGGGKETPMVTSSPPHSHTKGGSFPYEKKGGKGGEKREEDG